MKGETLQELREELQSVRGETRVKQKEEAIRNRFLQAACNEVITDHDWPFTRRAVAVTALTAELAADNVTPTGRYEAPALFSMFNNYYVGLKDESIVSQKKEDITVDQEGAKTYLTFKQVPQHLFIYHEQPPDLVADATAKIYFPQHILIAERAYTRLKTAYFPDENSDKELAQNRRALRELYKKAAPKRNFTTTRWG